MGNRSNINLVGNTTQGQNVGMGADVYKGKATGNLLQFRSIAATGSSVQIFQTDDEILIYAEGGSSGTTYTFENGLTKTLTNVTLGGELTENTNISGGTAYSMTFDTCSMYMCGLPSKTTETCALYINSEGKLSTGIAGEGGGGITGATNGLCDSDNVVKLGGNLCEVTTISGDSYNYSMCFYQLSDFGVDAAAGKVVLCGCDGNIISIGQGIDICGGNTSYIHMKNLPTCTTQTDVIYIDSAGKLYSGATSGGGFLGTVTQSTAEPSDLKDNQWVKPAPTSSGVFNYTFTNFCDSGSTAINVNLSLEDVYLRYCDGGYWVKEYYDRPITSGYTWIGDSTNKVCEVRVINEWVSSESEIDYTGQKYSFPTQTIFQVDVGTCVTIPNKIFIQNINLQTTGNTCLFTIPTSKCVLISSAKLIMKQNASTDTFTVSIGNNYNITPSLSYRNMITNCQISNVNIGEVYELLPATDLQSCISGYSVGSDVCLRVQSASTGTLCADLLLEGFVY